MPLFNVDWEERVDFDKLRRYRVERAKQKMREHDLDAIVVFRVENVRYLTGLRPLWWPNGQAVTRNAAILSREGDLIAFVSSGDLERAKKVMSWIKLDNVKPLAILEDRGVIKTTIERDFAPTLRELGVHHGKIGLDAGTFVFIETLKKALPTAEFVDGDLVMVDARKIKSSEEVKCLRLAALVADLGINAAIKTIDVGRRECEILGEAMRVMYSYGMEVPQCNLIVASGDHTAPLHRFASDRIINWGDLVIMDIGGCFNGYFSDCTRTVIFGKPTNDQKQIYRVVYKMMQEIIENLRPGLTNTELNEKARGVIKGTKFERYGYYGILGHGIGVSGLEPPLVGEIVAKGERIFKFEPGMTFSFEPAVFIPGIGGVRLENNIAVTETGNEVLNKTPYDENLL